MRRHPRNVISILAAALCTTALLLAVPALAWAEDMPDEEDVLVTTADDGAPDTANEGICGTCRWYVTDEKELVIEPLDGVEGTLDSWEDLTSPDEPRAPWRSANATTATIKGTVHATTCINFFKGMKDLTTINLTGLDTSTVTYTSGMFSSCYSLTSLDLSELDTSNVEWAADMFTGCTSLTSLDLSPLDTSSMRDMGYMFASCRSLTTLDLSGFDTSKVEVMSYMFASCSSLTAIDLSGFDTSLVQFMGGMFKNDSSLTTLDLSGFNTSKLASVYEMFSGCSSLTSLDLSGFKSVEVAMKMFDGCTALSSLKVGASYGSKMDMIPVPTAPDGWWSTAEGRWMTREEISASRMISAGPKADTYLNYKPAAPTFSDVTATTAHADDIAWLASAGISKGWLMPDGTREFRGEVPVIRQDMAAFLYRLAGSPDFEPTDEDKAKFVDVTDETPHAKEIWWLARTGVTEGWRMPNGTREFRGTKAVIRQDMAAFLQRLASKQLGIATDLPADYANPFCDVNESTAHYSDILWLASSGISRGWLMPDGTREFRGTKAVIRQDMAAFLHRLDGLRG